jgi:hypothetical protein
MNPMKKIFLPCALLVTMAAAPLHAEELTSVLTVSGNAILEVPADQLQVSIGVEAEATTVDDAHSKAVASMESVIKAMKRLGLQEKDEYTIERYDVSPQWSTRPRNNQEPNWRATIVGYTVRTNMHIKTGKLDLASKIISSSVDAGANDIGNVIFDLADPRTSRSEAIERATHNAMTDAQTMADAAGVKLVHIQSLHGSIGSNDCR